MISKALEQAVANREPDSASELERSLDPRALNAIDGLALLEQPFAVGQVLEVQPEVEPVAQPLRKDEVDRFAALFDDIWRFVRSHVGDAIAEVVNEQPR